MITSNEAKDSTELIKQFSKWIAFVPIVGSVIAYTLAFIHEVAYCNIYHIPVEFITLNWTTIIIAVAGGSFGLMLGIWAYLVLFVVPRYSKNVANPVSKRFSFLLALLLMFMMVFLFLNIQEFLTSIGSLVLIAILLFIGPIFNKEARIKDDKTSDVLNGKLFWAKRIIHRTKKLFNRYKEILSKYDKLQFTNISKTPKYFYSIMVVLFFTVLIFGGVYLEGRREAGIKNEFYVPSNNPKLLVLKIYGDNIICVPFRKSEDGKSIIIYRKYTIMRIGDNLNLELIDVSYNGTIKIMTEPYPLETP
jgi:hypothetical protein